MGDLSGIREGPDWGDHGNLDLHGWAFDRFISMLEYKAAEQGISVERVDERDTSKSCGSCGTTDDSQRVERGLYVCETCGLVANADQAFRQREIVEAVDVPAGSVGPTLSRLEEHGLVEHRDRFWAIADAEHALASAGVHGAATADELDGGFADEDVDAWMETAVDPIDRESDQEDEPEQSDTPDQRDGA